MIAGLTIQFTGWQWLDPAISFLILGVILWSTWGLLRDSFRLALDGVPPQIDPEAVRRAALDLNGIVGIHHIHAWAMSTTQNALTAHLVLADTVKPEAVAGIKHQFRHTLEHLHIAHATLETEFESKRSGTGIVELWKIQPLSRAAERTGAHTSLFSRVRGQCNAFHSATVACYAILCASYSLLRSGHSKPNLRHSTGVTPKFLLKHPSEIPRIAEPAIQRHGGNAQICMTQ